ncbi:hypothetical protein DUNSADRAFT_11886 [Dunaliella salina]|uniref:Encoded protein n=1 Tax=Dunaliella salina TaxID=3046 RepID=A0ABQ7H493_DUNSA|nr:hypothetical protein DUNSADRAFT_11886 [Dunaliella salina]|eukprot:KAF5841679.1 hypothetical protein DUNSADRAFT_11886 [Dunaliella salina]
MHWLSCAQREQAVACTELAAMQNGVHNRSQQLHAHRFLLLGWSRAAGLSTPGPNLGTQQLPGTSQGRLARKQKHVFRMGSHGGMGWHKGCSRACPW